jgi:hypothetical protein
MRKLALLLALLAVVILAAFSIAVGQESAKAPAASLPSPKQKQDALKEEVSTAATNLREAWGPFERLRKEPPDTAHSLGYRADVEAKLVKNLRRANSLREVLLRGIPTKTQEDNKQEAAFNMAINGDYGKFAGEGAADYLERLFNRQKK